ncbi:MAG TPA: Rossmann-like and DUF2520 domain-containing protein [Candidatus Acidoferrales bacterium]|jgi:predicted short-subunit dehydrogenase-like oxidoreductase (DUF2520 family)|nr:Rossmann-like and DUF2520 domain-containing protein [Candidatus Acidoferrales bacterium]
MLTREMKRTFSIIGAGRVGQSLGRALLERGWGIGAVVTRSPSSARAAVRAIGGGTPQSRMTADALASQIILIATPDDAIASVAQQLARVARGKLRGKVVLHTSGALDRRVLAPLARMGAATGSMHPMQTFSGKRVPRLKGIVFAIEGDGRTRQAARAIARSLGGVPIEISGTNKPAYHAAGVLAAGHALALIESATQILTRIGFPRRRAEQTLLPLMKQVLNNFESIGPRAAWTGPVARGDHAVVGQHMRALGKYPPEFSETYAVLARLGARTLSRNSRKVLREVERALKSSEGGKK